MVVLDVEIEIYQHRPVDIRPVERVALVFWNDDRMPWVLAMREDFPLVPPLNQWSEEKPRSLCLYDQAWSEARMRWTPVGYVERISAWLALTARGELHAHDQPLEPLLMGSPIPLILPEQSLTLTAMDFH